MQLCLVVALYCSKVAIANVNTQTSLDYKLKDSFLNDSQEILKKKLKLLQNRSLF